MKLRPFILLGSLLLITCLSQAMDIKRSDGDSVSVAITEAESSKEVILKKARNRLAEHFKGSQFRLSVSPRWIPRRLLRTEPGNIISVELAGGVQRHTDFQVVYKSENKKRRTAIQLVVDAKKKVPVASNRITAGSKVKKSQLSYQWVSILEYQRKLATNKEQLKGKILRKTVLSGQPIRLKSISRELVITAGDEVKMVIQKNGVTIEVKGVARENGAVGDRIRMYSKETRRKYTGEVVRPGVILWKNTL